MCLCASVCVSDKQESAYPWPEEERDEKGGDNVVKRISQINNRSVNMRKWMRGQGQPGPPWWDWWSIDRVNLLITTTYWSTNTQDEWTPQLIHTRVPIKTRGHAMYGNRRPPEEDFSSSSFYWPTCIYYSQLGIPKGNLIFLVLDIDIHSLDNIDHKQAGKNVWMCVYNHLSGQQRQRG